MKHLFVINPVAGGRDATPGITAQLTELFGNSLESYEIHRTESKGSCIDFLKKRLADETEYIRVYSCGGDGTLNEVLNGVAGFPNVSLTCHPTGTGNDFIKIFNGSAESFKNLKNLINAEDTRIDILRCKCSGDNDGRYSLNICSVGLDARVAADVHRYSRLPLIGGAGGYIMSLIFNVIRGISQEYSVTLSGAENTGRYSIIVAANGRYYGGGFYAVPEAMPDDRQIDFLVVPHISRFKLASIVGKYKNGRHNEISDTVNWSRGGSIRVRAKSPFTVNIDGEVFDTFDVTFELIENALTFAVPKGATWR